MSGVGRQDRGTNCTVPGPATHCLSMIPTLGAPRPAGITQHLSFCDMFSLSTRSSRFAMKQELPECIPLRLSSAPCLPAPDQLGCRRHRLSQESGTRHQDPGCVDAGPGQPPRWAVLGRGQCSRALCWPHPGQPLLLSNDSRAEGWGLELPQE